MPPIVRSYKLLHLVCPVKASSACLLNITEDWPEWRHKIQELIPWICGYAYDAVGEKAVPDLRLVRSLNVERVHGLQVICGIKYEGDLIEGSQISDSCCLEKTTAGASLYLDAMFDDKNNAHLQFLSSLMVTLLDPHIEVRRVEWIMVLNQYFRQGEISGINPYNPQSSGGPAQTTEPVGEEEVPSEGTGEEASEEGGEVKVTAEDTPMDSVEAERGRGTYGRATEPADDGLNEAPSIGKQRSGRRKTFAPSYRGGGAVKPHAVNYAYERDWVRKEAQNFCQVCVLSCESCGSRQQGQCSCEVRKNAERALVHHHLQPYGGDWKRDVRGNLIVLCAYHHKQLDGTDVRLGYLRGKALLETRANDLVLSVYPKNKDETEVKIRLSKSHFDEFVKYTRTGAQ